MIQNNEQQVSGRQVLTTMGLWIFLSAIAGAGTFYSLRQYASGWATVDNLSVTIVAEVYFLFLVAAFVVFGGVNGIADKLSFKYTSIKDLWLAIKWYCFTLSASVAVYFLLSPFIGPLPGTLLQVLNRASDMSRLPSAGALTWFFIIIRACLLAPLTEELLFRGLLFGWFRSHFSGSITILFTAILFTSMHYYPILFPLGFLFGLSSGWVRKRTGSSFNFVIAHIANSILFLVAAYLLHIHT
jgi:membrane protease YdiL (CAAX protease family)